MGRPSRKAVKESKKWVKINDILAGAEKNCQTEKVKTSGKKDEV
jgi:hypothetical protein